VHRFADLFKRGIFNPFLDIVFDGFNIMARRFFNIFDLLRLFVVEIDDREPPAIDDGRNPMMDGFGLIAFAALAPIIFVLLYGLVM